MTLRTLHEDYSLAWLEMTTITILTLIGSLFTLLSFIKNHTQGSRSRLETVCDSINTASEQIANTPYLLLQTSANAIATAKENIYRNLSTAVLVIENVIVWIIRMYKSTYRCLLELAVRSVLSLVTQIAGPVQTVAQGVTSILNLGGGTGDDNRSTTTLNWAESLTNVQRKIDDWFKNEDDMIHGWVDPPFQAIQTQLNNSFSNWQAPNITHVTAMHRQNGTTAAASQSTVPCQPQPLVEALENAEFQLIRLIHIFIGVLLALFLICVLVNLLFIRIRHGRVTQARRLFLLRHHYSSNSSSSNNSSNNGQCIGRMEEEQEHLDKLLWSISTKLSWRKRHNAFHQLLCFMAHPIVLYCLVVGLSGLILIRCLASVIETKAAQVSQDMVQHTKAWTIDTTSDYMLYSQTQVDDINRWLNITEVSLNDQAFGVIKSSALAINNTLTTVVQHVHGFIDSTLGGTLLETPAKELTQCLLLTKIDNLQQGLTWLASHSYVQLTRVHHIDYLSRYQSKLQESISNHIDFLFNDYGTSFLTEQLSSMASFYYMLIILWGICLCIGIAFQVKYYFFSGRPALYLIIDKPSPCSSEKD